MSEYVSLKQLADELGMDRSNLRKYVIREGFQYGKRRMIDSGSQTVIAFTEEEAQKIRDRREANGFGASLGVVDDGIGFLYITQIVPDLDPNRVKLGYARNVGQRLQQHRTTSPTAQLMQYWPCKEVWEQAAIDCIMQEGGKLVGGEVYDCENTTTLTEAGHRFFEVMPKIKSVPLVGENHL